MPAAATALEMALETPMAEAAIERIGCNPLVRFVEEAFAPGQIKQLASAAVELPEGFPKMWGTTSHLAFDTPQVLKGYEALGSVRKLSVHIANGFESITAENPDGLWSGLEHRMNPVRISAQGPRAYLPGEGGHFRFEYYFSPSEPARVPVTTMERSGQFIGDPKGPLKETDRIAESTRITRDLYRRPYQGVTEYHNQNGLFDVEDRPPWPAGNRLQINTLAVWDGTRLPARFTAAEPIPITEVGMGGVKRTRSSSTYSFL